MCLQCLDSRRVRSFPWRNAGDLGDGRAVTAGPVLVARQASLAFKGREGREDTADVAVGITAVVAAAAALSRLGLAR